MSVLGADPLDNLEEVIEGGAKGSERSREANSYRIRQHGPNPK